MFKDKIYNIELMVQLENGNYINVKDRGYDISIFTDFCIDDDIFKYTSLTMGCTMEYSSKNIYICKIECTDEEY